ncbi:MAG TPA: hydroxymethylglutaryl-CoA reductase, degradative [Bdellovibrionota bacterium]|jgi:hydroxymethylglutaryl-CoA reductase|nr:hydroxymethylglutaryl-CoA reductase, degradative [Bdellovibrionota bacterium]
MSNANEKTVSSRIRGFYTKTRGERLEAIRAFSNLDYENLAILARDNPVGFELSDTFIENAIGSFPLPLGIATSFKVNDRDYLVPMAVEESSVVAAASNAARWAYETGGFRAEATQQIMIGQIQLLDLLPSEMPNVEKTLFANERKILQLANDCHPRLVARGGGARGIEVRSFPNAEIPFMVLHILIDAQDAMGANLVNTACESLAPHIEIITGARVCLRILSNLASHRLFTARCSIDPDMLKTQDKNLNGAVTGADIARRIVEAYVFADNDPYRAATHNKGIMNGVDPVVIATGNDWRAIEAGVHAYAAQRGHYRSLSRWSFDGKYLHGELTLPLQLGTVGGVTKLHPVAQTTLKILRNPSAAELGMVIASAGLASNLAALRALCTAGIQKGHMRLHAKNVALAAGAVGREVEQVAQMLVAKKCISSTSAEEILQLLRSGSVPSKASSVNASLEMGA